MAKKRKKLSRKTIRTMIVITGIIFLISALLLILNGLGVFEKKAAGSETQIVVESTPMEMIGEGLQLVEIGRYSGEFFEDGSNDKVSDVLMVKLQNTGETDLRFARLMLSYGEFTGEFVITDLPAGKTVIVLEKNRSTFPKQDYLSFMLQDVVRFKENMDVCADRFEITGMEGALNVRNISQTDIDGDVYVYYKMISGDVLYGGITFRVKIEGGLRAGELRQVSSEHFSPDRCMIMSVTTEE